MTLPRSLHVLSCLIFALTFLSCASGPEEKDLTQGFAPSVALAQNLQGDALAANKPLHERTLLSVGETLSTGEGHALLVHENGVRVQLRPNAKAVAQQLFPQVQDGTAWFEFPRAVSADGQWRNWKLRGQDAIVEIIDGQAPLLRVISGEILAVREGARFLVKPGHQLALGDTPEVQPMKWWQSTAGGLENRPDSELDVVAGQGVLGARHPGDRGKAHIPLVITNMDVKVRIVGDHAITEVTQEFLNPTRATLEGVYRFGAPEHALVTGFAVDRNGRLVYGKIKGKEMAKAQYESNVYAGSTEDPALLEWEDEGRYRAFIYPILGGQKRTVFIRYTTWLPRMGEKRDRRIYTMAMLGSDGLSPEIGDFSLTVNLRNAGASAFRANLGLFAEGEKLRLTASDFQVTSDLHVELFDGGVDDTSAHGWYERPAGRKSPSIQRGDHAMIRLRPFTTAEERSRKLDLAILVDVSADTSPAQFQMARAMVENLVTSLQPGDRVTILTGDMAVREKQAFVTIGKDDPTALLEHLSAQKKGGATDISGLIEEAAAVFAQWTPGTAPVLLYVGNGVPTVGLLDPALIAQKWAELPVFVSFRAVAIVDGPGLDVLTRLAGDVKPLLVTEPGHLRMVAPWMNGLRRPILRNAEVSFDTNALSQPYPRGRFTMRPDEDLVIVGHASTKAMPKKVILRGFLDGKAWEKTFQIQWFRFTAGRELARRWAYQRLLQYMQDGASPEELLDLGLRYDLVTPFTSLYVPTAAEATAENDQLEDLNEEQAELEEDGKATSGKKSKAKEEAKKQESEDEGGKDRSDDKAAAPAETSAPADAPASEVTVQSIVKTDARRERSKGLSTYADMSAGAQGPGAPTLAAAPVDSSPAEKPAARMPSRPTRAAATGESFAADPSSAPGQGGGAGWGGIGQGGGGGVVRNRPVGGNTGGLRGARMADEVSGRVSGAGDGLLDGDANQDIIGLPPGPSSTSGLTVISNNTYIFCADCGISRAPSPCSALSKLPLWQRVNGWRERLAGANPWQVMEVYQDALRLCEAPSWHARSMFLRVAVAAMTTIQNMVQLYQVFVPVHGFGDILRTAILAKITRVEDILYVRRNLGLGTTMERVAVEEMLTKAPGVPERIAILQQLRLATPEDPWLTLRLLRIYEENQMNAPADEMIRSLYGNPLLDDELRLNVVEYYLRRKETGPARRLLSEMVEFSPRDPSRRRMLGQLYQAFGWKAQAVREFLSFSELVQNTLDARLYLAFAYEATGEFEKALKYIEDILTSGDPGSDPVKLARLSGCLFLARMRLTAAPAIKETILNRGRMMALFRDDEAAKIILTAAHPKADLELVWGPSQTDLGRVPFIKPSFGVQAAILSKLPSTIYLKVERAEADSPRPLTAELVIILGEGTASEKLFKKDLTFEKGKKQITLKIEGNQITVVSEN